MQMQKLARGFAWVVRYLTIPPLMALALLTYIQLTRPEFLGGSLIYWLFVVFLVVFPVSSYALHLLIPCLRRRGRECQRDLAIYMSVAGYVGCVVTAFWAKAPFPAMTIALTYFFSGLLIFVFNKLFRVRASGHACGVSGPVGAALVLLGSRIFFILVILVLVYWASLYTKRHTWPQLLWGTAIPWLALSIAYALAGLVC